MSDWAEYRKTIYDPMDNDNQDELVDMTPVHIDFSIKSFVPQLCCQVNPVAIIYKKRVCQQCFEALRAAYTRPSWDLGGGSD